MHTDTKLTRTIICPHNPSQSSTGSPTIDLIWLRNRLGFVSNCYELENLEVFGKRIQTGQPVSFKDQKSFLEELTFLFFRRGKHMEIIGNRYWFL